MFLRNQVVPHLAWLTAAVVFCAASMAVHPSLAADKSVGPDKEQGSTGISLTEFQKLHKQLQIKGQPWAAIPWQLSITEARKLAAKENKPILLSKGNGHLLACG